MNALKDNKRHSLHVAVTPEARRILDELAKRRAVETGETVYPSDIARDAIEAYLNGLGYNIQVKVNRGGNRRPPTP